MARHPGRRAASAGTAAAPRGAYYGSILRLNARFRLWTRFGSRGLAHATRPPPRRHSRRACGQAALDRSCSVASSSRVLPGRFLPPPPETSGGHVFRRLASCARPSAVVRNGPQRSARARTCRPPIQQLVLRTDAQVPCLCPSDPVAILYALARRVHVLSAIVRSRPHSSTPVRTCQPRNAPFDARCVWVVARRLSRRPNALPVFTASRVNAVTMRHGHLSDTPIARTRHRNGRASAEGGARIRCGPVLPTSCGCRQGH